MNIGLSLISRILEDRDIKSAIKGGVDDDMFDPETSIYWDLLKNHYEQFTEVPSVEYFKEVAPQYKHLKPKDSMESLIAEAKTQRLGISLQKGLMQISQANGMDPWAARDLLVSFAEKVLTKHQTEKTLIQVGEDLEAVKREIKEIQTNDGVVGIPWPWDYLNEKSQGLREGELYYLYGREASGKTFLNLWLGLHFWKLGYKVLWFTREASYDLLKWRIIALALKMDMGDVQNARYTTASYQKLIDFYEEIFDSKRFIISEDSNGITGFKAHTEQIKPDVVIHDYIKSMADDAMEGKVQNEHRYVARTIDQVKEFAVKAKIPIFVTGHANRKGVNSSGRNSDEHAWSDHIVRRCDCVVRLITCNDTLRTAFIINKGRSMQTGIGLTFDAGKCSTYGDFISAGYEWVNSMGDKKKNDKKDTTAAQDFIKGNFKF